MRLFRALHKADWNRIVSKAEKLVGYSGSYANAQYLLNDEISQVAFNVRKLISSGHPLVETAKHLRSNENFVHIFGLTVLLVSRASNPNEQTRKDNVWDGILDSQRSLAEITELVYTSNFIHRGVVNAEDMPTNEVAKLTMGNKMAVLGGDLLLANASVALAKLRNPFIVNEIAQGISDMTVSLFVDNNLNEIEKWERQVYLGAGSLLSHACRSSVRLVFQNALLEDAAFSFAKYLTYVMALYYNSSIDASTVDEPYEWSKSTMIFPLLRTTKENAQNMAAKYSNQALDQLNPFPESDAKRSLADIGRVLSNLR